jgi:hypothetical protein
MLGDDHPNTSNTSNQTGSTNVPGHTSNTQSNPQSLGRTPQGTGQSVGNDNLSSGGLDHSHSSMKQTSGSQGLPAGTGPGTTGKGGSTAQTSSNLGNDITDRHTGAGVGTGASGMDSRARGKPCRNPYTHSVLNLYALIGSTQSNTFQDRSSEPGLRTGEVGGHSHRHHHHNSELGDGSCTYLNYCSHMHYSFMISAIGRDHTFGHNNSSDAMPKGDASSDSHQLNRESITKRL